MTRTLPSQPLCQRCSARATGPTGRAEYAGDRGTTTATTDRAAAIRKNGPGRARTPEKADRKRFVPSRAGQRGLKVFERPKPGVESRLKAIQTPRSPSKCRTEHETGACP